MLNPTDMDPAAAPAAVSAPNRRTYGPAGSGDLAPRRRAPVPESLRGLYDRYCEMEAMDLLSLMPREALRTFYARATEWVGASGHRERSDPLDVARGFARSLLLLPTYEDWIPMYLSHRSAYLQRLGVSSAPRLDEPVTVAVREFGGDGWYAALCLCAVRTGWDGFIQFHQVEGAGHWRTTSVFRNADADEILTRFRSFDDDTLQAFLRSVLP